MSRAYDQGYVQVWKDSFILPRSFLPRFRKESRRAKRDFWSGGTYLAEVEARWRRRYAR